MANKQERERRRTIERDLRGKVKQQAEAALPSSKEELQCLFEWVDERVQRDGCDHSLRYTREFIRLRQLDEDQVAKWLADYGGYCDCEVITNVRVGCPAFH